MSWSRILMLLISALPTVLMANFASAAWQLDSISTEELAPDSTAVLAPASELDSAMIQRGIFVGDTAALPSARDTVIGRQERVFAEPQRHSPSKAAWRAAAVPGWGQIYNRKYWKLPLVYGGLGALGYWVYFNADQHRFYRQAFIAKTDDDPATIDPVPQLSEAGVLQTKEFYRRQLDASALITVAFYGLQIVDAVVDAHLFEFDVSDDLSLQWSPWMGGANFRSPGLSGVPTDPGGSTPILTTRRTMPMAGLQFNLRYR